MNRSPPPVAPAELRYSTQRQLQMYARAASAAGVSLLALSHATRAEIIYTPAHVQISPNQTVPLDLDQDGARDFKFKDTRSSTSSGAAAAILSVVPARTANQVWGHRLRFHPYASALFAGVRIGSRGQFVPGAVRMASELTNGGLQEDRGLSGYCSGPWANVSHRYLGLTFRINGEAHFGWARLNVSCPANLFRIEAELTGYAYETVAGKSIRTGQTHYDAEGRSSDNNLKDPSRAAAPVAGTLGQLALGAEGSAAQRRTGRIGRTTRRAVAP